MVRLTASTSRTSMSACFLLGQSITSTSIEIGGAAHTLGGTLFQPTILSGVTGDMRIAFEETYGPVAPLFRFESVQDVIEQANNTIFGLASYIFMRRTSPASGRSSKRSSTRWWASTPV